LRSSRGSIIVNGIPTEEFQFFKGLKKGLRINMSKSKIMRVHVEDEKVKYATSKLGCLILNTSFSYLGTKVGGSMSRVQPWKEVVDKKTSLWARVIKAIYGDDGKVGKVTNAGIRSCWMNIVNEISVLKNQGINVFDFMRLKLGNEDTTTFWEDNWIGGNVLKD
nr:RNA-directed DNA polymerase, eukaryota, reverse transcriptase zinc-binding domain protein [Tanacetum cinerariifolium]